MNYWNRRYRSPRWVREISTAGDRCQRVAALVGILLVGPVCATAGAETFSMPADYSVVQNPIGPWTIGFKNSYTGSLVPFDTVAPNGPEGMMQWHKSSSPSPPNSFKNISSSTHYGTAPGQMTLHPGPNLEPCTLRWTAPADGTAQITGTFYAGDSAAIQYRVHLNNTTELFANNNGATISFNLGTIDVTAGDTIDFMAGGAYFFGTTPIEVDVDFCSPSTCPGDVTNDNLVNVDDLLGVINSWGLCTESCCLADVAPIGQSDQVVDVNDLLAVINAWGSCK